MDQKQPQPKKLLRPRRVNKQSIVLWVDANVESNAADTKNTIDKLNKTVDDVELIDTPARCIEALNKADPTKCYVITSGALGKELVPQIHAREHIEAIFIFCGNEEYHKTWTKKWPKIRGVHTKIDPICDQLKPIIRQVKNDDIAMSVIASEKGDQVNLQQLPPSFMYTGLLKDVFLTTTFTPKHFNKMVQKLLKKYEADDKETPLINEFAKNYRTQKAIWWYTRQCFTYTDVNASLRLLNADMIVDLSPFIVGVQKQIKQLYDEQLNTFGRNFFTVYRGQGMAEEAFRKLSQSKNGLLSFDCFLSTSKQRSVSLEFAEGGASRSGHVGILFIIKIDPALHVVPFAHIKDHSFYPEEDEVLFGMHSIFKIGQVQPLSGHTNLFEVQLQLTDEDDPKLRGLKKHFSSINIRTIEHRLGWILNDMGEHDKAEEVYLELLEKETNERQKGLWNHELGYIKDKQGRYQEAIEYYQKALEIDRRVLSEDDPSIAKTYNCIGAAYYNMGKYSEALENHTKAVRIREKVLQENHPDLAQSYNNIGSVYIGMGDYPKALTYYEKSHEILKKTLPENHPHLATSYNNIGEVYRGMGEYQKALPYSEKSLEIYKRTLPENHPLIATSYHNMGCLFYNMKKYKQALENLEKARRIFLISLPPTHPHIKTSNKWIEKVKSEMN